MVQALETDYLVVGAGAMGLAFADEVLTRSPNARIIILDKRAKPGGHWNDAYPFVSLHQPAALYGVSSEALGTGGAALASGGEVLAYFERVVNKWVATGRLQFFPMCEYIGNDQFASILAPGREYRVMVRKKTVDASYMKVEVPATKDPAYAVSPGISLIPPNGLTDIAQPWSGYVIIGGGKTGIDAVLFLLELGVEPDAISWIIPNDSWFLDRDHFTPGYIAGAGIAQLKCLANATTPKGLFESLEATGLVLRLDSNVWPTKYRCATVNQRELEQLRGIRNIVRMGRVSRIEPTEIVLQKGRIPTNSNTLHVDCTADGLAKRDAVPIFDGNRITLQSVFLCQQVFSAAILGFIETKFDDDETKNNLCEVVPHPELERDYVSALTVSIENAARWANHLGGWLRRSRLFLLRYESWWSLLRNGLLLRKLAPTLRSRADLLLANSSNAGCTRRDARSS